MLLMAMVMRRTMTMVRQEWFVGKDDVSDGGDDDVRPPASKTKDVEACEGL